MYRCVHVCVSHILISPLTLPYFFPILVYLLAFPKYVLVVHHKFCSEWTFLSSLGLWIYLITFFHPNSLHTLDPVVECFTRHTLYHSSAVSSIPSSFSHFSFMYTTSQKFGPSHLMFFDSPGLSVVVLEPLAQKLRSKIQIHWITDGNIWWFVVVIFWLNQKNLCSSY